MDPVIYLRGPDSDRAWFTTLVHEAAHSRHFSLERIGSDFSFIWAETFPVLRDAEGNVKTRSSGMVSWYAAWDYLTDGVENVDVIAKCIDY